MIIDLNKLKEELSINSEVFNYKISKLLMIVPNVDFVSKLKVNSKNGLKNILSDVSSISKYDNEVFIKFNNAKKHNYKLSEESEKLLKDFNVRKVVESEMIRLIWPAITADKKNNLIKQSKIIFNEIKEIIRNNRNNLKNKLLKEYSKENFKLIQPKLDDAFNFICKQNEDKINNIVNKLCI